MSTEVRIVGFDVAFTVIRQLELPLDQNISLVVVRGSLEQYLEIVRDY